MLRICLRAEANVEVGCCATRGEVKMLADKDGVRAVGTGRRRRRLGGKGLHAGRGRVGKWS